MAERVKSSQKLEKLFQLNFYRKQERWKLCSSKTTIPENSDNCDGSSQDNEKVKKNNTVAVGVAENVPPASVILDEQASTSAATNTEQRNVPNAIAVDNVNTPTSIVAVDFSTTYVVDNTAVAGVAEDSPRTVEPLRVTKRLGLLMDLCQKENIVQNIVSHDTTDDSSDHDDFQWQAIPVYSQENIPHDDLEESKQERKVFYREIDSASIQKQKMIEKWMDECSEMASAPNEDALWIYERCVSQNENLFSFELFPRTNIRSSSSSSTDRSVVDFMRYAHNSPHSSVSHLDWNARPEDINELRLAGLSSQQLSIKLSFHVEALRKLLRESMLRNVDMIFRDSRMLDALAEGETVLASSYLNETNRPTSTNGGRGRGRGRVPFCRK